MAVFEPPPTWALPILVDERSKEAKFNPVWLKWFVDLAAVLSSAGGGGGTIQHNSTGGLQGGSPGQYYHLTSQQYTYASALLAVAANGILVRTSAGNYSARTITGTAGAVVVTNGDGVSGNPTISLVQDTGWSAQTATPAKTNLGAAPTVGALASWAAAIQNMLAAHGITDA